MPDFDTLPPNLELVEIENARLRDALEKIERLAVCAPKDMQQKIIGVCRKMLNV